MKKKNDDNAEIKIKSVELLNQNDNTERHQVRFNDSPDDCGSLSLCLTETVSCEGIISLVDPDDSLTLMFEGYSCSAATCDYRLDLKGYSETNSADLAVTIKTNLDQNYVSANTMASVESTVEFAFDSIPCRVLWNSMEVKHQETSTPGTNVRITQAKLYKGISENPIYEQKCFSAYEDNCDCLDTHGFELCNDPTQTQETRLSSGDAITFYPEGKKETCSTTFCPYSVELTAKSAEATASIRLNVVLKLGGITKGTWSVSVSGDTHEAFSSDHHMLLESELDLSDALLEIEKDSADPSAEIDKVRLVRGYSSSSTVFGVDCFDGDSCKDFSTTPGTKCGDYEIDFIKLSYDQDKLTWSPHGTMCSGTCPWTVQIQGSAFPSMAIRPSYG